MIKISDSQLLAKLANNDSLRYFITVGSDPYLQYLTQNQIIAKLRTLGFAEHNVFAIDNQTDWDLVYQSSQAMSLFSSQTLLILQFGETALNVAIAKKLDELTQHLSPDVSVLISLTKMSKTQENAQWLQNLSEQLLIVSCNTPDAKQLPQWIEQQSHLLTLTIEKQGIELLAYYYEGNLLALSQILDQLKLLYPKGTISYDQLEGQLNDSAIFTPYHWIDAMLLGKTKRSMHILQQLKVNDIEPLILLRSIQRELILLINLKKYTMQHNLKAAYDAYKVWQSRRNLITPYLNRINLNQLYQVLKKLAEIEVMLKHDYHSPAWERITALNILFIGSSND
ncbi:DNA polymerase III delta subunit [Orbus hercynius]|uniref:DNA polymerase III subunit delta n=1 Tax=Orbus hercynius TaxID=593135 RepID=A0A495RHK5_9GAMM|nr:DNA polymerase III subunit delta [Orbus hercynius]RKS86972.1 DNA polymerase III delta subunit [Orbus hercynius]